MSWVSEVVIETELAFVVSPIRTSGSSFRKKYFGWAARAETGKIASRAGNNSLRKIISNNKSSRPISERYFLLSSRFLKGVKDKGKRCKSLSAVLWPKGEENYFAFAVRNLGERDLAVQIFFAEHPAGHERVFLGICRDDVQRARFIAFRRAEARTLNTFKRRARDEVRRCFFQHTFRVRLPRVDI